jgi:peptide/nickel transport system permease protein
METYEMVFTEKTDEIYKVKWFTKGPAYKLFGLIPTDRHLFGVEEGGFLFLFGSDSMGRDLFSRMILGSQVSLTIPFAGTFISFIWVFSSARFQGFRWMAGFVVQRISKCSLLSRRFLCGWPSRRPFPPMSRFVKMYLYITIIISLLGWTGLARIVPRQFHLPATGGLCHCRQARRCFRFQNHSQASVPGFMSYLIVNLTLGIPSMIIERPP